MLDQIKFLGRRIEKERTHFLLNLFGLSIAVTCCIPIMLFIHNEFSYNRNHRNHDHIYRVLDCYESASGTSEYSLSTPPALSMQAIEEIPGVLASVRTATNTRVIRFNREFVNTTALFADPSFFDVFSFPLANGSAESALSDPNSIVIGNELANRLFPGQNPIGQSLEIQDGGEFRSFTITGVLEPVPENSTFNPEIIHPMDVLQAHLPAQFRDSWYIDFCITYFLINDQALPEVVEEGLQTLRTTAYGPDFGGMYALQSLNDEYISLSNPRGFPTVASANGPFVLLGIAVAILLLACINYTLLTLGRSAIRSKEVGIRKILGARRTHLLKMIWFETAIITLVALLLGIMGSEMTLPLFNLLAERNLSLHFEIHFMLLLFAMWVVLSILAGLYPSLVISGFSPSHILKNTLKIQSSKSFRRYMILVQFSVTVCLLIVTIVMSRQFAYVLQRDLGYSVDQVVELPSLRHNEDGERIRSQLVNFFSSCPGIEGFAEYSDSFSETWTEADWQDGETEYKGYRYNVVTGDFIDLLGIEITEGRNFSSELQTDSLGGIIVNEAFVRKMGWTNAVGRSLPGNFAENRIIGVVEDFHYHSLYNEIEPLLLIMNPWLLVSDVQDFDPSQWSYSSHFLLKVHPGATSITIHQIEDEWHRSTNTFQFNSTFLDEVIADQYEHARRWRSIILISSLLALIISLSGVIGLVTMDTGKRTREIGIRKVLGASSQGLVYLFSKEYVILILIANVISWPIAWYISQKWLEQFAFKVQVSPFLAVAATILIFSIAWVTIVVSTWKAANANPVKSLRYE